MGPTSPQSTAGGGQQNPQPNAGSSPSAGNGGGIGGLCGSGSSSMSGGSQGGASGGSMLNGQLPYSYMNQPIIMLFTTSSTLSPSQVVLADTILSYNGMGQNTVCPVNQMGVMYPSPNQYNNIIWC
nr:PREDICTED: uncharacterized protein LOC109039497 [Bemisia tabaci]